MSTRFIPFFIAGLSWLFGAAVLLISLQRTGSEQAVSISSEDAARKWYWNEEIGPDHSLYPLIGIKEHLTLATLDSKDQLAYQVTMAKEKLSFISPLLEQNEQDFALNALVKGHTMLLESLTTCLGDISADVKAICYEQVYPEARVAFDALVATSGAFPVHYQPAVQKLEAQYRALPLSLE